MEAAGRQPLSWVRVGVGVAALGYGVVAIIDLIIAQTTWLNRISQLVVAVICTVAVAVARRRPRLAASLVLGSVWCQLVLSLCTSNGPVPALVVFPLLVIVGGLLLEVRGTLWIGWLSGVGIPVGFLVGKLVTTGAVSVSGVELPWLIATVSCSLGAMLMTRTALRTYGALLQRSSAAHRRYQELFELNPDGLLELDPRAVVIEANASAHRLLSQDGRGGLAGRPLRAVLTDAGLVGSPDPTDATPDAPLILELAQGGRARALEVSSGGGAGALPPAARLLVLRDVTERRLVQERLGHAQRLETVGQLAGGVAHDFNNLLTVIGGNAEFLAESRDPEARDAAAEIRQAQHRGLTLTRQLLAFARREVRRPERLDIAEVVADVSRLLQRLLGEQHRLQCETHPGVGVTADRGQLEQILINLVSNARDAMPGGGTVVVRASTLDCGAAAHRGSTLGAASQALLEVADGGVGMTAETRAHIFEPFFTTKPRGQGTGLGLATVHGIVNQSDGCITVDSTPGKGSTFRLFFPAVTSGETQLRSQSEASATPAGHEAILLVEDDASVAAVAERVLTRAGYQVVVAEDATLARAAAATRHFDMLVTDMRLPGPSGAELAELMQREDPGLRVLFISGYFDEYADGSPASATLLPKPFTPAELLERVRAVLNGAS